MQPVDLFSSETYEREIPHEYFNWLRDNEPAHWQVPGPSSVLPGGPVAPEQAGFWAISRYRDVVEVSLDQKRFSSERVTVLLQNMDEERVAQLRLWMINQDAPRHTKLRKLINKGFTIRMI